ncbi:hypothetical protein H5410_055820 [Solanum commersonii]|uniref:NB-ARC domain containing protein n=1 Tax=Solanum commersonii TaxID=4109 RepID=A0A9J5WLC9_SOLCO|nr:hypothetical protein H5410_055820 [Solanum commersonii]
MVMLGRYKILDEKRAGNKSLVVDKSGVHDQVVEARDLEYQTKENSGHLLGKAVAHKSVSGDQSLTTRKTLVLESQIDSKIVDDVHSSGNKVGATETLEKNLNENQLSLTTNPTLVHIDDDGQNNAATIVASTIDDGQQLNGTRDPVSAKVVANGVQHDARGDETVECLVDNMTQKSTMPIIFFESDVRTNSIALMNAKNTCKGVELKKSTGIEIGSPIRNTKQPVVDSQTMNSGVREFVSKEEQQGVTSTPRWANIADEEEEQVTSPPMKKKLSPRTPTFVPSSAKLVTPRQGLSSSTNVVAILSDHLVSSNIEKLVYLTPINTNKQLQVCGSSSLSPNKFANLDDVDIFEEGEEEKEEMLNYCFANAARNANMFPRQQHNNKMKHGRKHSWDGKVTEEFVPRHLPM